MSRFGDLLEQEYNANEEIARLKKQLAEYGTLLAKLGSDLQESPSDVVFYNNPAFRSRNAYKRKDGNYEWSNLPSREQIAETIMALLQQEETLEQVRAQMETEKKARKRS